MVRNKSVYSTTHNALYSCDKFSLLTNLEEGYKNSINKPQCRYGLTVCKCPISSQTIKYRYKFKSNQKILLTKNACMDPLKVCTKFGVYTSLS